MKVEKVLVVVDMQEDFVDGSLGSPAARTVVAAVRNKILEFQSACQPVYFTLDTHDDDNYLSTQEGKKLPVKHCIRHTKGWEIYGELKDLARDAKLYEKNTFGSLSLASDLAVLYKKEVFSEIELVGLCTDICVISNALLLKAFIPEVQITVDASCCAGVTKESHHHALEAMKMCQITITGEA